MIAARLLGFLLHALDIGENLVHGWITENLVALGSIVALTRTVDVDEPDGIRRSEGIDQTAPDLLKQSASRMAQLF